MKKIILTDEHKALITKMVSNSVELPWMIHAVFDDPEIPGGRNVHTHGLEEFGGDLQCILPANHNIVGNVLNLIGCMMQLGLLTPEENEEYEGVLGNNYKIKLIKAEECGRTVWRVLLPDKNGDYFPMQYFPEEKVHVH